MLSRSLALLLVLGGPAVHAAECDPALGRSLAPDARVVQSLRLDKPGAARVYGSDGTAFTGAEALWLKGQLRALESACRRGDRADADARFMRLRELVRP